MRTLRREFVRYVSQSASSLEPYIQQEQPVKEDRRPTVENDRILVKHMAHTCRYVRESRQDGTVGPSILIQRESEDNYLLTDKHILVSVSPQTIDRIAHEYKLFSKLVPDLPAIGKTVRYNNDGPEESEHDLRELLDLTDVDNMAGCELVPMYVSPISIFVLDSVEPYTYGFITLIDYTPPELRTQFVLDRYASSAIQTVFLSCFNPKFWELSLVSPQCAGGHDFTSRMIVIDPNFSLALGSISAFQINSSDYLAHYPKLKGVI